MCERTSARGTALAAAAMNSNPELAPLWAMVNRTSTDQRQRLARALHAKLYAPETALKRRVAELGLLARLLEEQLQPADRLPYIERKLYTQRRAAHVADAPTAEWLCIRYGSWKRACFAAWGLLEDGYKRWGTYEPRLPPGKSRPSRYTADDCLRGVRECAEALGFLPSSWDFHRWQLSRAREAKSRGGQSRVPPYRAILRELAPERGKRQGWQIVVKKVFDQ